jgi:hypothetical protein
MILPTSPLGVWECLFREIDTRVSQNHQPKLGSIFQDNVGFKKRDRPRQWLWIKESIGILKFSGYHCGTEFNV